MSSLGQKFLKKELVKRRLALSKVLHIRLGINSNLDENNIIYKIIEYLESIYLDKINFFNIYTDSDPSLHSGIKNIKGIKKDKYSDKLYINGLKIIGLNKNINQNIGHLPGQLQISPITLDYSNPIDFLKKVNSKVIWVKPPKRLYFRIPLYNHFIFHIKRGDIIKLTNYHQIRYLLSGNINITYQNENDEQKLFASLRNHYMIKNKYNYYVDTIKFTKNYRQVNIDSIILNRYIKYSKSHIKSLINQPNHLYDDRWKNNILYWLENLYTKNDNYNFDSSYVKLIEMFILYKKIMNLFPTGPNKQIGISDTFEIIKSIEANKFLKKYLKKDLDIDEKIFIENNYHLFEDKVIKNNSLFRKQIKNWFRLQLEFYNLDSKKIIPY